MRAKMAVILLLAVAGLMYAGVPPTATLTLIPDKTLPGTAVGFLVTINNPSDSTQIITNSAALKVTASDGVFDAHGMRDQTTITIPAEDLLDRCGQEPCISVPPQGQRQLYIDPGPLLAGNEFFADRRLSLPGTYRLQLSLQAAPGDGTAVDILTNSTTLTVEQPTGADLAVWQRLQQLSDGNGWGSLDWALTADRLGPEIRSKYPSSAYVPWVTGMGLNSTVGADTKAFDDALSMNPPNSLRDDLLWHKAAYLAQASRNALTAERNEDQALALADKAREAFTTLQRLAISEVMRKRAADGLAPLYTRRTADETLRVLADNDPPATERVVPRVECVDRGAGNTFSARFAYANPNKGMKGLPVGDLNQVTPAPRDQGQPRVFKPGDHPNAFAATSPGGNLIWHLDHNSAVATADFPTLCGASATITIKP